ncbi:MULTISPECIES: hypothetical protein [unclassified Bacillus (in: firmicutes)]|uniref:hypothetical protein n=1 Tax=unclassified Bacillus (in: firmicutes) TaxID=185979 RepID=UPI00163D07BD|nr:MULTISPECIES: hypothetical protein [unclassified Bacillus (in: firmicutes)]QNH48768.1 hypothetical protein H7F25_04640 [Bacillus sp. PAMC28571]QNK43063.1 hypothetical protein H7F24_11205 [Bacillus sp. PAMC22265]
MVNVLTYRIMMILGILIAVGGCIGAFVLYDQAIVDGAAVGKKLISTMDDTTLADFAKETYETSKAKADQMWLSVIVSGVGGLFLGAILFAIAVILRVIVRRDIAVSK